MEDLHWLNVQKLPSGLYRNNDWMEVVAQYADGIYTIKVYRQVWGQQEFEYRATLTTPAVTEAIGYVRMLFKLGLYEALHGWKAVVDIEAALQEPTIPFTVDNLSAQAES